MKLLAVEAIQNATYYLSRYRQVQALGADLYVLNGEGTPDFWPAERYRIAGSKDIGTITAAAQTWDREHSFDGILTFSEAAVVTVAAIAEALGLPGIGVDAARTSRNKVLMRRAHARGGVPHPDFRFVTDVADALEAAEEIGYPVVLKPTLGAASNFVFRIDTPAQMERRVPQAAAGIQEMSWFRMEADGIDLGPHGLLVESFLDGRELLIEALAWDGEVYLGSVVDRITVEGDTFDDDVHAAPTSLTRDELAAVHRAVAAGAHAQGLRRSAMHAEIRFHRGRPYVIEIAARPGGGSLDHMARLSAAYCPIRAALDGARGVRPPVAHYRPTQVHTAAMCLVCEAGKIVAIDVPDESPTADDVFFLKITARPGDIIRRPPHGNDIVGFLGARGRSFEEAMWTATDVASRIRVDLAPAGSGP